MQGQYLGRLDLVFNRDGEVTGWTGGNLLAIDDSFAPDTTVDDHLAGYRESIESYKSNFVGSTTVELIGERSLVRTQETNLGNAVADSMLLAASETGASMALVNGGGIRASIPAGDISLGDVLEVLPFHDPLVAIDITGGQLVAALENSVSMVEEEGGRFLQIAGCRFTWDPEAEPGSRVVSADIDTGSGYQALIPDKIYRVVTTHFLAGGGDGYHVFTYALNTIVLGDFDYQVFVDYIGQNSPLAHTVEGRITRLGD
jgi:2',3'-cyclic-nucleotide 2'-phosphodiesterase (5'-nucleotidase family)